MALHFSFKSQSKTPPFNSEDRYQCGWRILRNAFPEALAVVLLPNQGHLLLPDTHEEIARARLNVCLRTKMDWHPWAPVPPPNPTPGSARILCALRRLALLPYRKGLARNALDWKWSTYLDLMGGTTEPWIDAHRLQQNIGKRGPDFLHRLHNYVCAEQNEGLTQMLQKAPKRPPRTLLGSQGGRASKRKSLETLENQDWRSLARPPQWTAPLHQKVGG